MTITSPLELSVVSNQEAFNLSCISGRSALIQDGNCALSWILNGQSGAEAPDTLPCQILSKSVNVDTSNLVHRLLVAISSRWTTNRPWKGRAYMIWSTFNYWGPIHISGIGEARVFSRACHMLRPWQKKTCLEAQLTPPRNSPTGWKFRPRQTKKSNERGV